MEYKNNRLNKIGLIIVAILFIMLVCFASLFCIYYSFFKKGAPSADLGYAELYDWKVTYEGEEYNTSLPDSFDISKGQTVVLTSRLPSNIEGSRTIDFFNSLDADLYINGVLRYSYNDNDTVLGGIVKQFHSFIEIGPEDKNGVLTIVSKPGYDDKFSASRVYVGSAYGVLNRIIDENFINFALAISLIMIGAIAVATGVALRIVRKSSMPIIAAGVATLFVSFWLVFGSELFQFMFANHYVGGIVSYMFMLLMGYPIIAYVNQYQKGRYVEFYIIMCTGYEIVTAIFLILHFAGRVNFIKDASGIVVLELLMIVGCMAGLAADFINKRYKEYIASYIGVIVFLTSAILEFIFYIGVQEFHTGVCIMTGTYIWLLLALAQQFLSLYDAERARSKAVNATEAKSAFLANMSHEIRTPMNAILGMDEMIIRESESDKVMKYAGEIKSAGNMLLSIINDILDLSKIETGKAELIVSKFKIYTVINDVLNITRSRATDKGLKYNVNVSKEIPRGFVGDEVRIRQIMLNVISNAIKYTNEGEIGIDVDYKLRDDNEEGKEIVIAVSDTGIGIKEEDKEKLFESFERLELTRNRNIEGTGLGLTITLNYLNMMGGRILVDSEYGVGSVFTIHLPLEVWDATPMGDFTEVIRDSEKEITEYIPTFIASDAKVLIVDDNEMNLDVIDGLLEETQINVDNAMSGEEALSLVSEKQYDVIMIDQMMPGLDGTTTMKKMRDMGINIPIIVLTADAGARTKYLEEGFDDFVAKPVRFKELEEVLARHLPKELQTIPDASYEDKAQSESEGEGSTDNVPSQDGKLEDMSQDKKKVLVINNDPDTLLNLREEIESNYSGTYLRDMDAAKKYLKGHDVDYILLKDLDIIDKANG